MRYILYLFTMALLFVGGMMVGNVYLPQRAATLAASVSVPPLDTQNPALQNLSRQTAEQNLDVLNQALQSCQVVVNEEKDRLINEIRLLLAVEDFEIKKARMELEMAKNTDTNRPTSQFIQSVSDYNSARTAAEQLANALFPLPPAPPEQAQTQEETPAGTQAPAPAQQPAPAQADSQQKTSAAKTAEASSKK